MQNDEDDLRERLAREASRLRDSGALGRSDQLVRLFDYLLQTSLSGHAPKEVEIAQDVFDLGGDAESMRDAPVRIYAHRLRRKLEAIYDVAGTTGDRLTLLRGEYRLTLVDADAPHIDEMPRNRTEPSRSLLSRHWPWVLGTLLAVLSIAVWINIDLLQPISSAQNISDTRFWKPLFSKDRPVRIVVGDYYISGGVTSSRPEYISLSQLYVPGGVTSALSDLLPILARGTPAKVFRSPLATSRLSPDMMQSSDIVFVGLLNSLGILRGPFLAASGFEFGTNSDEIIDKSSGRRFGSPRAVANEERPHSEYAYLANLTGPKGNQLVIVSAYGETGLIQAAQIATDRKQLERIGQMAGTASFEALYEVKTLAGTTVGRKLVLARKVKSPAVW